MESLGSLEEVIVVSATITADPQINPPASLVLGLRERLTLLTAPGSVSCSSFLSATRALHRLGLKSGASDWIAKIYPALEKDALASASVVELSQLLAILTSLNVAKKEKDIVNQTMNALIKKWSSAGVEVVSKVLPCALELGSPMLLNLSLSKAVQHAGKLSDEELRGILQGLASSPQGIKAFFVGARRRVDAFLASTDAKGCLLVAQCLATAQMEMFRDLLAATATRLQQLDPERETIKQYLGSAVSAGGLEVDAVQKLAAHHKFRFEVKETQSAASRTAPDDGW